MDNFEEFKPSKYTVMIAEDQAIIALSLSQELKQIGYNVFKTVHNGQSLIDQALILKPDIIITDIRMKDDVDGITAVESILKKTDPLIVFMTGFHDEQTMDRVKQFALYRYLIKPCHAESIHSAILSLFKQRGKEMIEVSERDASF